MAELTRGTRRLDWLTGRIRVEEILAAADETAPPARRPGGPHLGLTTGPLQSRRTTRLPAPPPRIRPADLEASTSGLALYGARLQTPWPYAERSAVAGRDAAIVGVIASYQVPDFAAGALARVRVNRAATAATLVVQVELLRGGRTWVLWSLANADLETAEPVTLLVGDTLQVSVTTAGTAGVEVVALLSIAERT
jgi:hypothetical protein